MKHNKKKFVKFTFWLVVVMLVGFSLFNLTSEVEYRVQEKQVLVDNLKGKIEEIKDEALESLKQCESAGYSEEDGIIIFDSNNQASIGQFQFQKKTVIHYYKILFNKDITAKEAVLIAMDTAQAKKLAYEIIYKTEKGHTNWYNCSKKIGLTETLKIVNKLES